MKIVPLIASRFLTDGGTMFGLVPKTIWARLIKPDENNRIRQHAHVLLIELPDGRRGLVDTGCGDYAKFDPKEAELHGLGPGWPLMEALKNLGVDRETISFVIFSHLHWDHVGGASMRVGGEWVPTFPNAVHYMHAQEWECATGGDPLLYKSYPADSIAPLKKIPAGQLHLVREDKKKILPGITMIRSGGHTKGHAVILIEDPAGITIEHPESMFLFPPRSVLFAGDVCPTSHNLRMVFQASYDTYPLETRQWKRTTFPQLVQNETMILFDHDPDFFGATIVPHEKKEFVTAKVLHTHATPGRAGSLQDLETHGRFKLYKDAAGHH